MTQILVTGNNRKTDCSGFSLLEVLVVLVIISITLGTVSLMLPSTEQREWKDLNRRLIVSLNHGKDETTLSGAPIMFQIDEQGWRFLAQNLQDETYILGDALAPYRWRRQTRTEGTTQFYLDELGSLNPVSFKVFRGPLATTIYRRIDGYFEIQ